MMKLNNSENELLEVARRFGTPSYLYDAKTITDNYRALADAFHHQARIFYSLKANPNLAICELLCQLGACAEVCSLAELMTALKAGFKPSNIIYVGPAKSPYELEQCLLQGIELIVCESKTELDHIVQLATKMNVVASIAIRINPNFTCKDAPLKMGGAPSQFGFDEDTVFANPNWFSNQKNLRIRGIHVYNATRMLNAQTMLENLKAIVDLSYRVSQALGLQFDMLDVGGGMGIPYFKGEQPLDLAELQSGLSSALLQLHKQSPNVALIVESGRFLVATAGVMISEVIDVKSSKGQNFIVTNGGTNCHLAAVGLNSFIKRNFPSYLISKSLPSDTTTYHVTGPLCTPGDLILRDIVLPTAQPGDLLIIACSGAYGPTASPTAFLGHGFPAEVLWLDGQALLVRERDTVYDLTKNQKGLINERRNIKQSKTSVETNTEYAS